MLLERLEFGILDNSEMEKVLQKRSWIKQGLNMFKKLRKIDIEGVLWAEIDQIENDVTQIETQL